MLQFGYNTGVINAPEVVCSFIFFKQIRLHIYIKISTIQNKFLARLFHLNDSKIILHFK